MKEAKNQGIIHLNSTTPLLRQSIFLFPPLHLLFACFSIFCPFAEPLHAEYSTVVLRSQDLQAYNLAIDGFIDECKKNNIIVTSIEDMAGDLEKGRIIINKYKDKNKPDLFLAVGVLSATLSKKEIKNIPVIFCMVVNHQRFQLGGRNIAGIASELPEESCLKIYKDVANDMENIGIIYDPFKTENIVLGAMRASKGLGLNLITLRVRSEREVKKAIDDIIDKIDALWLIPDSTVISRETFKLILDITIKREIPLLCTSDAFVKAGALLSVFPDYGEIGKQAGKMAKEILNKGDSYPLGVKYPEKAKIVINTETAQKIRFDLSSIKDLYNVVEYP